MSKFSWLNMPLYQRKIPPMAFPGFRYVSNLDVLCRITYHDRHLFQFPTTGDYTQYLVVELTREGPKRTPYLHFLTLKKGPRKAGTPVF